MTHIYLLIPCVRCRSSDTLMIFWIYYKKDKCLIIVKKIALVKSQLEQLYLKKLLLPTCFLYEKRKTEISALLVVL